MTPESLACPYCNSMIILTRLPEADQRIRCPRCEELFAFHGQPVSAGERPRTAGDEPAAGILLDSGQPASPSRRPLSNWTLARAVLAVMAVMGCVALLFALSTMQSRRARDLSLQGSARVPVAAPGKLAGLAYLPADIDFVAGIHVGELMDQPATARILDNLTNERAYHLDELQQSTNLALRNIDHIVIGANLERARPPTIVVKTRAPYDKRQTQLALAARSSSEHRDRTLYSFEVKGLPFTWPASVWFVDERTLVFYSVPPKDANDAPVAPEPSLERFPAPIRDALNDKLSLGTQIWSIGHIDDWAKIRTLLFIARAAPPAQLPRLDEYLDELADTHTGIAWLKCTDKKVTYHLEAGCKDNAAAKKLDETMSWIGKKWDDGAGLSSFLRGDINGLAKDLTNSVTHVVVNDEWVMVEAQSSIQSVDEAMRKAGARKMTRGKAKLE